MKAKKEKQVVELNDKIPFGKHFNSKTIKEIIDFEPWYYDWLLSNPHKDYTVSFESYEYFKENFDRPKPPNLSYL